MRWSTHNAQGTRTHASRVGYRATLLTLESHIGIELAEIPALTKHKPRALIGLRVQRRSGAHWRLEWCATAPSLSCYQEGSTAKLSKAKRQRNAFPFTTSHSSSCYSRGGARLPPAVHIDPSRAAMAMALCRPSLTTMRSSQPVQIYPVENGIRAIIEASNLSSVRREAFRTPDPRTPVIYLSSLSCPKIAHQHAQAPYPGTAMKNSKPEPSYDPPRLTQPAGNHTIEI